MTDQIQTGVTPSAPGDRWTRRRALTILAITWAALALYTMAAVMAGHVLGGLVAEGQPEGRGILFHTGMIGLAMLVASLAAIFAVPAILGTPFGEQHEPTDVTPLAISLPSFLLPPAICIAADLLFGGTGRFAFGLGTIPVIMMTMFRGLIVNQHLGPIVRRRAPDLWQEARDRRVS